jgi:hypothetical protein
VLLLALTVNAAFANVQMSELTYRTHLVSRIWASLFLAACLAPLANSGPLARMLRLSILLAFVGLGIWGGVERQDYFLATWLRHRAELTSIVESVPRLRPQAALVLYMRTADGAGYQATEVTYGTASWARLLYGTEGGDRVYRCAEWDLARCRIKDGQFIYVFEGNRPRRHSYALQDVVILQYSHERNAYELLDQPPAALRAPDTVVDTYEPRRNIEPAALAPLARTLLHGDRGLARLLPRPNGS